jgi:hypothetical protein
MRPHRDRRLRAAPDVAAFAGVLQRDEAIVFHPYQYVNLPVCRTGVVSFPLASSSTHTGSLQK